MELEIIVKMKFGSHLYGTATEDSDIDYKGVYLPSRREILLGTFPKCHNFSTGDDLSKNSPDDIDIEIYSLHYFISLACEGQTVAMDMLHAPEEMLIESSEIWRSIVKERHRFHTKNLKSFINYARRQASKYGIKGSRLCAVSELLKVLKSEAPDSRLRNIWDRLPRIDHCYDIGRDRSGMSLYQVCGKTFQESASVGYVIPILEKFYNDYGERAKLASENRNIDWKAVSHALRAAIQIKEILTTGTITFPLRDAPFLIKVKEGKLDYSSEVAPILESLMDEVEALAAESSLPEEVDVEYWNNFICEVMGGGASL